MRFYSQRNKTIENARKANQQHKRSQILTSASYQNEWKQLLPLVLVRDYIL